MCSTCYPTISLSIYLSIYLSTCLSVDSEVSAALLALEATAEWASAEPRRWRESPRLAAMAIQAAPPPRLLEAFRNAFESSGGGGGGVGSGGSGGGGGGVRLSSKGFAQLGARRVRAAGAARATSDAMGALLRQVRAVAALSLSLSPSPSLSLSLSLRLSLTLALA